MELYNCPWMTWSKRNTDITRLTLLNLLNPPVLNTFGLLNYDFPLILEVSIDIVLNLGIDFHKA